MRYLGLARGLEKSLLYWFSYKTGLVHILTSETILYIQPPVNIYKIYISCLIYFNPYSNSRSLIVKVVTEASLSTVKETETQRGE